MTDCSCDKKLATVAPHSTSHKRKDEPQLFPQGKILPWILYPIKSCCFYKQPPALSSKERVFMSLEYKYILFPK
jgi:hypothetical protein